MRELSRTKRLAALFQVWTVIRYLDPHKDLATGDWEQILLEFIPKVENACLQKSQPPDRNRLNLWLRASVTVPTKPNWYFVKLHTHGVNEPNQDVLLGEPMVRFHEMLSERANRDPLFRFHYVTAREMANVALAAERGLDVTIQDARSLRYIPLG